ncbi:MAG: PPC domain-containing DNA-binding protein [Candidatus Omnitrophota bacterium]
MQVTTGRKFIGRFGHKKDLLAEISDFCKKENVRLGVFSVIGALTNVNMGFYDQELKKYTECISLDKKLEISSCIGNVSLKDNEIFVHAHIALADHEGRAFGGHLMPGSAIFAAEFYIQELEGNDLVRKDDPETGLSLWV